MGEMTDIFPAAEVVDGKINVSKRYQEQWLEAMKRWEKKGFVQVILKAPEAPATIAQNNFFHAMLALWWKSRSHSFNTYDDMRETVKYRHGVMKKYIIGPEGYRLTKPGEVIQEEVWESGTILISWSKYTRKQRTQCIDGLIAEMEQGGILESKYKDEYLEILNGVKD